MHDSHPHLVWSVLKSATSQTGGKLLLTLIRFGIAVLIVRLAGVERFGEYSLVLTLLLIADWVADFAMTDAAVRASCREPEREPAYLRALAAAKVAQAVAAVLALAAALWVMDYPPHVVRAGMVGAVGTLLGTPCLVYRAYFKTHLNMERDVGAELIGALASAPLLWIACALEAPLEVLVGCYVASRAVTLLVAAALGRTLPIRRATGPIRTDVKALARLAAPLGVAGFFVAIYNTLDLLMLSKLADVRSVGLFSAAQRFIFPVLIAVDAVGAALFPVLASFWQKREAEFRLTLQRGIEASVVIAAGAFTVITVGAEWILRLLDPELVPAAPTLRLLALALVIRAATFILAPILLVTGRQRYAVWITFAAMVAKAALLLWLIPTRGLIGVAYAWIATDLLIGLIPAILITQAIVGYRIRLGVAPRIAVAVAACVVPVQLLGLDETIWGILLAGVAYPAMILVVRAITIADLRALADAVGRRFASGGDAGSPDSPVEPEHA